MNPFSVGRGLYGLEAGFSAGVDVLSPDTGAAGTGGALLGAGAVGAEAGFSFTTDLEREEKNARVTEVSMKIPAQMLVTFPRKV
jgi:hypothetical protein